MARVRPRSPQNRPFGALSGELAPTAEVYPKAGGNAPCSPEPGRISCHGHSEVAKPRPRIDARPAMSGPSEPTDKTASSDERGPAPKSTPGNEADSSSAPQDDSSRLSLRTEAELDTPNRETLVLLTVLFTVTFLSWGGAKLVCNAHPLMTRGPAKLSTELLAKSPKGAALERQQRLASYDLRGALELSEGAAAEEVKGLIEKCRQTPAPCEAERKRRADTTTRAVLLDKTGTSARAEVTSRLGDSTTRFAVMLERSGAYWKTTQRSTL